MIWIMLYGNGSFSVAYIFQWLWIYLKCWVCAHWGGRNRESLAFCLRYLNSSSLTTLAHSFYFTMLSLISTFLPIIILGLNLLLPQYPDIYAHFVKQPCFSLSLSPWTWAPYYSPGRKKERVKQYNYFKTLHTSS